MKIVVTGSNGFIGSNLVDRLRHVEDCSLLLVTRNDSPSSLFEKIAQADFIFHLAGINRPQEESEFSSGNVDLTRAICTELSEKGRSVPIVFSSSAQAELDNPYGRSKRQAEELLADYAKKSNAPVFIYRLPGVFGKWSRPNYNSVVATFCHNVAHNLPISISDPEHCITLAYIDDVIDHFLSTLHAYKNGPKDDELILWPTVTPIHQLTLGALAEQIHVFRQGRDTVYAPGFADPFVHKLYATYLSFLDNKELSYHLEKRTDPRGSLAEFIKLPAFGQIFVSRTVPGITRGNHYHNTKTEKFLVLEGKGTVRFRHLITNEILEYPVRGEDYTVVDIPPGYTHSIENTGTTDLVTLFWASEVFDPEKPDTYYVPVLDEEENV